MSITSTELIQLLEDSFLTTILYDLCVIPSAIPGSRTTLDIVKEQKRKEFTNLIIIDEQGLEDGNAFLLQKNLQAENLNFAVNFLEGGLQSFKLQYKSILKTHPLYIPEQIKEPLSGLHAEPPITSLKTHQNKLVDAVWFGNQTPRRDPPIKVYDHLYLGSSISSSDYELKTHGITHVIRLGWGFIKPSSPDINFYDFHIEDSIREPINVLFDQTSDIIHQTLQNGHKILVHCHAGVSRSSTIILAYMLKHQSMNLYEAWNFLYKVRPIIRPNSAFAKALQDLEKSVYGVDRPTLGRFWMSESYMYYIEYVEFIYRLAGMKAEMALTKAEIKIGDKICMEVDGVVEMMEE